MRNLRIAVAFAAVAGLFFLPSAWADLTVKDGGGVTRTIKNFVCETTKFCNATVIIASDGTEISPATAGGQTTTNTSIGAANESSASSDSATSGLNGLIKRLLASITTLNGKIDTLNTNVTSAIPAGTALIGKVGIDQTTPGTTNAVAAFNGGSTYETVAASQTGQILGSTGAIGDYLSHCVIYPTTTTPGVVTVFDDATGASANVIAFPGGASSVSNLVPIAIPVGSKSVTGEWRVTTGANLVVTCYGKFT